MPTLLFIVRGESDFSFCSPLNKLCSQTGQPHSSTGSEEMGTLRARGWHWLVDVSAKITQRFLLSMSVFGLSFSLLQPLPMSFVLFLNSLESSCMSHFLSKKILKIVFMLPLLYSKTLPSFSNLPRHPSPIPRQLVALDSKVTNAQGLCQLIIVELNWPKFSDLTQPQGIISHESVV